MRVLYDGWALEREPSSPAALHLLAILPAPVPPWPVGQDRQVQVGEGLPDPGVETWLALPGPEPPWLAGLLSESVRILVQPAAGRLRWEQWTLPRLARQLRADLIHLFQESGPLLAACPVLYSPCQAWEAEGPPASDLSGRTRRALAVGRKAAQGLSLLWPEDLPPPQTAQKVYPVPPRVAGLFQAGSGQSPAPAQSYLLYHAPAGMTPADLETLVAAWSWAGQAIGVEFPLYILGLSPAQQARVRELLAVIGLMDTVQYVCAATPLDTAHLYREARALLHLGPFSPWGDPLLFALASGLPIAAVETPWSSARLGPAGYLVPPGDSRALGAALVTLAVEDSVAEALAEAARQRLANWESDHFGAALLKVYRELK